MIYNFKLYNRHYGSVASLEVVIFNTANARSDLKCYMNWFHQLQKKIHLKKLPSYEPYYPILVRNWSQEYTKFISSYAAAARLTDSLTKVSVTLDGEISKTREKASHSHMQWNIWLLCAFLCTPVSCDDFDTDEKIHKMKQCTGWKKLRPQVQF